MATFAQVAARRQGDARSSLDLRGAHLRWTSQEPTHVSTVAQVAARQGAASSSVHLLGAPRRWTSRSQRNP